MLRPAQSGGYGPRIDLLHCIGYFFSFVSHLGKVADASAVTSSLLPSLCPAAFLMSLGGHCGQSHAL